jgi:hypothetical protein
MTLKLLSPRVLVARISPVPPLYSVAYLLQLELGLSLSQLKIGRTVYKSSPRPTVRPAIDGRISPISLIVLLIASFCQ